MKSKLSVLLALVFLAVCASSAFAQWSSDAMKNLPLADNSDGADQVQPKVKPLPNHDWYVSWFDADPNSPPPVGYSVYYQRLSAGGVEQFKHDGLEVAHLSNSSTEDYGLDIDTKGNALIAFLDTREGSNQQVTAAKMDSKGKALWGKKGVQLTSGSANSNAIPKIAGTSDGDVVVAWTSNSNVVVQKLNANGKPLWGKGVVFSESGYDYTLADLHAAEDGSVILSWARAQGFGSDSQLRANKLSAKGKLLWGKKNVTIFDTGSLQFGNFPYFIPDGKGGAVFSWYTSSPTLQVFAQHIRVDGSEAFPHNGSAVSTNGTDVRVAPSASYRASSDTTFVFWTEEDSNQVMNGVYGQRLNGKGALEWGDSGLAIVALGSDQQIFVESVQIGSGALVFWVDEVGFGNATIQATRLNAAGKATCAQFPVSSIPADKARLAADITSAGLAAVAFEDDRLGNNGIYIQNVNPDCSLGQQMQLR
jgi:hypothetical protein